MDTPRPSRGVRLTERDHDLLAFAAEHQLVIEHQLERLVGAKGHALRSRLGVLVHGGYLTSGSVFGGTYYQARPKGLAAVGRSLKAPSLKLRNYRHDVGVAWLWLAANGGTFGPLREVLGERSLRSHDGAVDRPIEPLGVRTGELDRHGNERLHYPDLLLVDRHGRRLALELELTPKGRRRGELILGAYGADPRIDRVLYLVESNSSGRGIRRGMEKAVHEMGLSGQISFQFIKQIRITSAETDRGGRRAAPVRATSEVTR